MKTNLFAVVCASQDTFLNPKQGELLLGAKGQNADFTLKSRRYPFHFVFAFRQSASYDQLLGSACLWSWVCMAFGLCMLLARLLVLGAFAPFVVISLPFGAWPFGLCMLLARLLVLGTFDMAQFPRQSVFYSFCRHFCQHSWPGNAQLSFPRNRTRVLEESLVNRDLLDFAEWLDGCTF